jgi:CubicO group peptidase (beta-lactamase class C family)
MHKGNWKGKQLIDSSYVDSSTTCANLSFQGGKCDFYGYQWWVVPEYKGTKVFYARGILGQAIVVVPEWNMIAVRLGKNRGEKVKNHFGLVFDMVDEMRLMMNK